MSIRFHNLSDAELAYLIKQTKFKLLRTKTFLHSSNNGGRMAKNLHNLIAQLERDIAQMEALQSERAKYMR